MPTNCCVPFCSSDTRKKIAGISFHEFPTNMELRDIWIRAVRRKDPVTNGYWIPADKSLICSLHFAASCFRKHTMGRELGRKRTKLVKGSVPTLFPMFSQTEIEKMEAQKSIKRKWQKPLKENQQTPLKEKQEKASDSQERSKWSSLLEVACAFELASEIEALAREPTVEAFCSAPSVEAFSIVTNIEVPDEHIPVPYINESIVDTSVRDELASEFDLDSTLAVVLIKKSPSDAAVTSQVSQSEPSPQETFRDPNDPHCSVPLPGGLGSGNIIQRETKGKSGVRRGRKNTKFLNKVAEKKKSSLDTVITTQLSGMKESINTGDDIRIVVTSGNEVKISAVREAFQLIFGKVVVEGIPIQASSIAPQPVGFSAGLKAAEEQIGNLRQQGHLQNHKIIIAISNLITEFMPDHWFDIGCLLLQDCKSGVSLQVYTEPIPVSRHFVSQAKDQTPADYPLGWSGHAVTIGQIIGSALGVPHSEWHQALTGVSRREILFLAAKTLAGLYKAQLRR